MALIIDHHSWEDMCFTMVSLALTFFFVSLQIEAYRFKFRNYSDSSNSRPCYATFPPKIFFKYCFFNLIKKNNRRTWPVYRIIFYYKWRLYLRNYLEQEINFKIWYFLKQTWVYEIVDYVKKEHLQWYVTQMSHLHVHHTPELWVTRTTAKIKEHFKFNDWFPLFSVFPAAREKLQVLFNAHGN